MGALMLIAVMSDTHDNRTSIRKALELARARGAAEVFHCGDLVSAPVVALFQGWALQYAEGNMDRDGAEIRAAVDRLGLGSSSGAELHLERDGLRIALLHGHRAARLAEAVESRNHHFVFHGHTHRRRDERVGSTRVVNPGALGGRSVGDYSFCLFNTGLKEIEFIDVSDPRTGD